LSNRIPELTQALNSTPTTTITLTTQLIIPSKTIEASQISTETFTPSLTPTESFTPTATTLPTEITDDKGVQMVLVPASEFIMGSDTGNNDEKPVHTVYLDAYYIDKYEVTNALYKACVEAQGCSPYRGVGSYFMDYFDNPQYSNYPVIISFLNEANSFCEWRDARVPTGSEWEKAARGVDGRSYPWGEGIDCNKANYGGCVGSITPVGSYESGKSPHGVYDMAGNVWELISEGQNAYGDTRGGAWNVIGDRVRISYLGGIGSVWTKNYYVGFRCVITP
jgi:formylglycine-generating enzyme required for sulfatase activity